MEWIDTPETRLRKLAIDLTSELLNENWEGSTVRELVLKLLDVLDSDYGVR